MSGIGIDACNNSLDVTVFQGETGQFTNPSGGHQKRVDWLGTLSVRQVVLEATGGDELEARNALQHAELAVARANAQRDCRAT
ncbi:hypothetical protein ACFQS6_03930 [Xanthomonas populi]